MYMEEYSENYPWGGTVEKYDEFIENQLCQAIEKEKPSSDNM